LRLHRTTININLCFLFDAQKKYAKPVFGVKNDTIFGRLEYGGEEVAVGTMMYKYQVIPELEALKSLKKTSVNLKIIPDVDYKPKIAQLVAYNLADIKLKGAWSGPGRLHLSGFDIFTVLCGISFC
jgi:acetoacetate decarboxylase